MRKISSLALVLSLLAGCAHHSPTDPNEPGPGPGGGQPVDPMVATDTLHPAPADYARSRIGTEAAPIPPWSKWLKGLRILLDPGHGGDAHRRGYKRGPTGVREAEMNERIALYLKDLLDYAGAEVRLTRVGDVDVSLSDRVAQANDWPADLFISLHHNAIDGKPSTNYTTVWYHRGIDDNPASLDLARHLSDGLHDALNIPRHVDVPLKSDQLMYQKGFGVLRGVNCPAALCESSFFTNPEEEQRLRDPAYNLKEAHGLFLALARYAAAGIPRAKLTSPATLPAQQASTLQFEVADGLRTRKAWGHERKMIFTASLHARLAGSDEALAITLKDPENRIEVRLPALAPGDYTLLLHFENMNKNSVIDSRFPIHVE